MKLYEKDLIMIDLSQVRDFYCMGCFTGLRFSDLSKLHLANISEDHIVLSIQKRKPKTTPLNSINTQKLFWKNTKEQSMNRYL
jgi:integrase